MIYLERETLHSRNKNINLIIVYHLFVTYAIFEASNVADKDRNLFVNS